MVADHRPQQHAEVARTAARPRVTGDDAEACARIYGQTWGTVYDTINYTVTGSLGDWMDSPIGLDADGIDNEMSFSHLDRNIVFEPQGEQLHVDGNKALIYAQIAELLNPPATPYGAPGRKGYLASPRLKREERNLQFDAPAGSVAQDDIAPQSGTPEGPGLIVFPFEVKSGNQPDGKNIFNGGLRVDITKLNFQGISDGNAVTTLKVQCKGCDDHPGIDPDSDGFITVAEDYNQSPGYAQGGADRGGQPAGDRQQPERQGRVARDPREHAAAAHRRRRRDGRRLHAGAGDGVG